MAVLRKNIEIATLATIVATGSQKQKIMGKVRVFSAFSGIGGFGLGIQNAAKTTNTEFEFIGHSEIDKFATAVYKRHFPSVRNYGDITKIKEYELPEFDCFVGGFCCQSHSAIGQRKGLSDPKGQVIFDVFRILKAKQPRLVVLENVKGLLSSDKGFAFKQIIAELDELGYDTQWQIMDSSYFGTPQTRERIIIIGFLRLEPAPSIFPIEATIKATRTVLSSNAVVSYSKTRDKIACKDTVNTITASYRGLGGYNEPGLLIDGRIRRLTPLECERLQTFPDYWTKYSEDGKIMSDSQRYKMCGNAVCTKVVQAVFEHIFNELKSEQEFKNTISTPL